jgi:hypothetical protein
MTHLIEIKTEVDGEFLSDILVTAFDGNYGGSWYWATPARDAGKWLFFDLDELWREVRIEEREAEEPKTLHVRHAGVLRGVKRILRGNLVHSSISEAVASAVRENDAGYIDATAADCIVQASIFNEIRYG